MDLCKHIRIIGDKVKIYSNRKLQNHDSKVHFHHQHTHYTSREQRDNACLLTSILHNLLEVVSYPAVMKSTFEIDPFVAHEEEDSKGDILEHECSRAITAANLLSYILKGRTCKIKLGNLRLTQPAEAKSD